MLYFSKLKIISVIFFTLLISYFTLSNIFTFDDTLIKRNINLGLDLQGGSYLLLEVDNKPVVTQHLQTKTTELKKFFKDQEILIKNISINSNKIIFQVEHSNISKTVELLENKSSEINPYFHQYKSFNEIYNNKA